MNLRKNLRQELKELGFHGLILYYLYNNLLWTVCNLYINMYNVLPAFHFQMELTSTQLDTWYV
jgi:hypothetical protein